MTSNNATNNAKSAKSDTTDTLKPSNVSNVSSTDFDSIFSAWINERDITSNERTMLRNWKNENRVQWIMNKSRTRAIAVYRHHDKITERANKNYLNARDFNFIRVYSVVLREHTEKLDKITGNVTVYVKNSVLATIGYDAKSKSFVLLSNAKLTVKTRTSQGSELTTLERASHAVTKAIKTASEHGDYTETIMHKVDKLAPTMKVSKVATVKITDDIIIQ